MAIKGIVCIGANGVMGNNGTMPWGDAPLDGAHFRRLTEGHLVVMGRKTFESMGSRNLPNRVNMILTRKPWQPNSSVFTVQSVEEAIKWYKKHCQRSNQHRDLWVIGGAQVFEAFMPYISEMYVTTVGEAFEGDTFFPDMFKSFIWEPEYLGMETREYDLVFRKFTKVRMRNTLI